MIGAMASIKRKLCEHQRQRSQCKECKGAAILSGLRASVTETPSANTCCV